MCEAQAHEQLLLTLVAHYGRKPHAFEAWLAELRRPLARLGDGFVPYALPQVHATIAGLEALRAVGSAEVLNANYLQLAGRTRVMALGRVIELLRHSALLPLTVQLGGFAREGSYPFTSRGEHPFPRSFSFQGERAVVIGWPTNGDAFPGGLAQLRLALESAGVLHKYHALRNDADEPVSLDNDLFFVLGRVRPQAASPAALDAVAQELRCWMARHPLKLVVDRSCLSIVRYRSATLPLDSSVPHAIDRETVEQLLACV